MGSGHNQLLTKYLNRNLKIFLPTHRFASVAVQLYSSLPLNLKAPTPPLRQLLPVISSFGHFPKLLTKGLSLSCHVYWHVNWVPCLPTWLSLHHNVHITADASWLPNHLCIYRTVFPQLMNKSLSYLNLPQTGGSNPSFSGRKSWPQAWWCWNLSRLLCIQLQAALVYTKSHRMMKHTEQHHLQRREI